MSLNYSLKNVADGPHTRTADGDDWGRWTENIIFMTMAVDMGEITEKNYEEFYRRWKMVELIQDYGSTYRELTLEVVKAHIGLHTNVATTTAAAWKKRAYTALEQAANDRIWTEKHKERTNG